MPAHWLELSPVLDTSKDWSMSPLSASCSKDWSTSPPPKRSKSRSKKSLSKKSLSKKSLSKSSWNFHQLLSHQLLLSSQRLLSQWSLARAGTASEATTSATTDASNINFFKTRIPPLAQCLPTTERMMTSRPGDRHPPKGGSWPP